MITIIKSTLLSIATMSIAFTGCAVQAQAQPLPAQDQVQTSQQVQTTHQHYVAPVIAPQPQPQNPYYFGFSIQLVSDTYGGKTLRIVSVSPGSPAQQAGLEIGDEIRSVNGLGFLHARDSFEAVNMLSRFVSPNPLGGGPAPAATAAVQAYVAPGHHQPIANMIVRNVRNGQDVSVTVHPTPRYVTMNGGPAPAISPPVAASVTQ